MTANDTVGKRKRGRKDSAAPEQKSSKGRGKRTKKASVSALSPTSTSFDFLHGAYEKVRRARLIQLLASGTALIAVMVVGVLAATAWLEAAQVEEERASQQAQLRDRQQALIEQADIGPLERGQMEAYIDNRGGDLTEVSHEDLPLIETIDQLQSVLPSGVELQNISLSPASGDGEDRTFSVSMSVVAADFDVLEQLDNALATSGLFVGRPELSWSGGPQDLGVSISATLSDQVRTERAQQVADALDEESTATTIDDDLVTEGDSGSEDEDGIDIDLEDDSGTGGTEPDSDLGQED